MRSSQKAIQFFLILFISFGYPAVTNFPVIEGIVISGANAQGIPGLDYKLEADKAFERGDYESAITLYNNALEARLDTLEDMYESHLNIGISMRWLGNIKAVDDKTAEANRFFENSIKSYDKAISLKPNDSRAYLHKGISLTELGKFDEAIKQYDKAISLNPKDYMAHLHKGFALGELKQYDKSLEEYKKAKELGAPLSGPLTLKSEKTSKLYIEGLASNDINNKTECYKRAIELEPNLGGLYRALAGAYRDKGDIEKAEDTFKKTMIVDPLNEPSYISLG
jgi:Tfp pilus assembly protein PilF